MDSNLKGILYIILGIIIVIFAADFLIKALFLIVGFYLIYRGLEMRNAQQHVLFYFQRFKNRF